MAAIVGSDFADVLPEQLGVEAEEAGIDFANLELLGGGGFLFDDSGDVILRVADNAAIAGWVGHLGSDD